MKQKIIYCGTIASSEAGISFSEVNKYLEDGWKVESVTAQTCASGGASSYSQKTYGGFVVVILKECL